MDMQPLDTLSLSKDYKAGGFTQRHAETQAKMLISVVNSNLATKRDIEELRKETKRDTEELRKEIKMDMKALEYRMMIFALFTALIAIKYWG